MAERDPASDRRPRWWERWWPRLRRRLGSGPGLEAAPQAPVPPAAEAPSEALPPALPAVPVLRIDAPDTRREPASVPVADPALPLPTEVRDPAAATGAVALEPGAPRRPQAKPAFAGRKRRISLALQGGGSHGAFSWGVLDRLLEEPGLEIAAVSGTSAGALNAAVLATGLQRGGPAAARKALDAFWQDVSRAGAIFSPFRPDRTRNNGGSLPLGLDALPGMRWVHHFLRAFSPYEFNPLNLNPLRDVIRRHVDESALRAGEPQLFITATSVQTGQGRVFTDADLSLDALLASACLPFLFQAIEIDGEPYWDGGYSGNPALYPLIYDRPELDIVLVKINPLVRPGTPRRTVDIMDRVSEITFNAGLIGEMRAIAFVNRMLAEQRLDPGRYKPMRLHMIGDDEGLAPFTASSKLDTQLEFLQQLRRLGRRAAKRFLDQDGDAIGQRSSLDIESVFLHADPPQPQRGRTAAGGGTSPPRQVAAARGRRGVGD